MLAQHGRPIEASPTVTAKIELVDDTGYYTLTCAPHTIDPRGPR